MIRMVIRNWNLYLKCIFSRLLFGFFIIIIIGLFKMKGVLFTTILHLKLNFKSKQDTILLSNN